MFNIDNILGKSKKTKTQIDDNISFERPKVLKQKVVAGKPVKIYNDGFVTDKKTINKVYSQIPDDVKIPLKFMTREQYLKKYINNQELKYGTTFNTSQKQEYLDERTPIYQNIKGRYTTKNNPYYKPAVIVFNDDDNKHNLKGKNFKKLTWHEYGHEFVEKNNIKLDPVLEEKFCDYLADQKVDNKSNKTPKQILQDFMSKNNISSDEYSKNMAWKTPKRTQHVTQITPREYLRKTGSPDYQDTHYYDYQTQQKEPIQKLSGYITSEDVEVDLPYVDTQESAHEGRHRALASELAGEKTIPVITPPPQTWRSPEVRDEFIQRRYPEGTHPIHEKEMRSVFDARFPTTYMDDKSLNVYEGILEEKDLLPTRDSTSKDMALLQKEDDYYDYYSDSDALDYYRDYRGLTLKIPKKLQGVPKKSLPSVDDISYFYDESPLEYAPDEIELKARPYGVSPRTWANVGDTEDSYDETKLTIYPVKRQQLVDRSELRLEEGDKVKFKIGQHVIDDAMVVEDSGGYLVNVGYINPYDGKYYETGFVRKSRFSKYDEETGNFKKINIKEIKDLDPKILKKLFMHETGHVVEKKRDLLDLYKREGLELAKSPSEYALKTYDRKAKIIGEESARHSASQEDIAESFAEWHPQVGAHHRYKKTEDGVTPTEEYKKRMEFFDTHLGPDFKKDMTPRQEYEYEQTPESYIEDAQDPRGDSRSEIYPDKTEEEYKQDFEKIKDVVEEKGEYTIEDIKKEENKNV